MNETQLPDPAAARRERVLRWIPALVFLVVPAALILRQLSSGHFLFGHDVTLTFYYSCKAVGQALAAGRLPVWDPHVLCGTPLLARIHFGALYPLTWPAAFLSPGAFWTLSVAIHLSLSGFFAHAWLTRGLSLGRWGALAGASVYMLSGFVISHVFGGHLSMVCAYPWAAALLWRMERLLSAPTAKRGALLSGACLMILLAGHPQIAMIALLGLAARLAQSVAGPREGMKLRARRAGFAAAALAIGGLLAAPQLLPTLELTGHTQRSSLNRYDFSTTYSLPPESLVTLIAPTFFGDSTTVPYWGRWLMWDLAGFIGISSLALAALGAAGRHRQRLLWLGLALIALLLAMGDHTPVFKAYYHLVPGATLFRSPARFLFLFTLAAVPLVAMGFDRLWAGDDRVRPHAVWVGAAAGTLLAVSAGFLIQLRSPEGGQSERWKSVLAGEAAAARGQREETYLSGPVFQNGSHEMALRSLGIAFRCLAGIAAALLACRRIPTRWGAGALGLILSIELLVFDTRLVTDHPVEGMEWPSSFVENVRSHPRYPFRIATVSEDQIDAVGKCQLAGLDHVGGYDPMMLRRYLELARAAAGIPNDTYAATMIPSRPGPIYDLLGARYWIVPGPKQAPPGWGDVGQIGNSFIYENPRALPRAFLVARAVLLPEGTERLRYLGAASFSPEKVVVLESGPGGAETEAEAAPGSVTIQSRAPGFYELRADCATDGWLVLTEAHYPGWTAEVDGAPAPIHRADHLVQALPLSRGPHTVRFTYRSRSLRLGFWIAGVTALLSLSGIAAARRWHLV